MTAARGLMDGNADAGEIALVLGDAAALTPCSRRSRPGCTGVI